MKDRDPTLKPRTLSRRLRRAAGSSAAGLALAASVTACSGESGSPDHQPLHVGPQAVEALVNDPDFGSSIGLKDIDTHPMGPEWGSNDVQAAFAEQAASVVAGAVNNHEPLRAYIEDHANAASIEGYVPLTSLNNEVSRGYVEFRLDGNEMAVQDGAERSSHVYYFDQKNEVTANIDTSTEYIDNKATGTLPSLDSVIQFDIRRYGNGDDLQLIMTLKQNAINDVAAIRRGSGILPIVDIRQAMLNGQEVHDDVVIAEAMKDADFVMNDVFDALRNKPVNSLEELHRAQ